MASILERLKELDAKATKDWSALPFVYDDGSFGDDNWMLADSGGGLAWDLDGPHAELIALSRTHLRLLIEAAEMLVTYTTGAISVEQNKQLDAILAKLQAPLP